MCSRLAALAAVFGALTGCFTAYALGVSPAAIRLGLWGYNPVLTMIAIGGVFYVLTWRTAVLAIYASMFSVVLVGAFQTLLAPVGMPALTWPFCFAATLFVGIRQSIKGYPLVDPAALSTPEGNLKWHRGCLAAGIEEEVISQSSE